MDKSTNKIKQLFFELTNKKVKSVIKFDDGFTNLVYLINDAYVLKMPSEYIQPFIDFKNEKYVLDVLKDNKNVVNVFLYDDVENILIMKCVHQGRAYKEEMNNFNVISVAKALKKIHKISDDNIKKFDMFERFKTYKNESYEKIDGRYERKIINRIKKSIDSESLCLCHNDLVKNNMLFKYNDVTFIDFEFAGNNYLYFDLASFISENNLDLQQKQLFLKTYFGYKLNKSKLKKVDNFIKFEDILWFYWAQMMYKNRKLQCYLDIKNEKLKRIKENIKLDKLS